MRIHYVLLIALCLWIPAAVFSPPTRQQELRVLISARNMLESGNFHRPEFQNQPRFRKPPMAYWLAAGGMAITGETRSAWAGRLFFVCSSVLGIWLLSKIAGPAGLHSALIALFSFGFWRYGPLAETDMIQLTGILLFFYAWQRQAGLLAGLGISFACLSKGPGGFLIPIISLIFLARFYRPDKKFLAATLLIPFLLIGGWILFLIGENSGLAQMQTDLTDTFLKTAHENPWYYYFYTLPFLMLPAGLLIFRKPSKKAQSAPLEQWTALTWLLVTLGLMMLTVSKQHHYALLMIPPAAWLIGMRIQSLPLPRPRYILLICLGLGIGETVYHFRSDDTRNASFLKQAAPLAIHAPTLHVVGINSAIFDFHLGRHVENIDDPAAAITRAKPDDLILLIQKRDRTIVPPQTPVLADDDDRYYRRLYRKD
jgi:4-amino-4-deoxy-L-arabinose transferase-like glycosyltransferase